MPNKSPAVVRETAVDPRVQRTTLALGRALIELLQERHLDEVTVQQILDRAGVSRAAFYAHYRNKHDALHASFERLFSNLEPWLERRSPLGARLFPVTELLAHVGESSAVVDALRASGQLEEVWDLCAAHAARLIERRIDASAGVAAGIGRAMTARMLAGALVEMLRWWADRPGAASPEEMDARFHAFARGALRGG